MYPDVATASMHDLSKTYRVLIDYDYHGCSCYESKSMFSIVNADDMETLLDRFGSKLTAYVNDSNGGNVLHDVVINDDIEVYDILKRRVGDDVIRMLANGVDVHGRKPIQLVTDAELFRDLLKYTTMSVGLLVECINNCRSIARVVFDELCAHDVIHA